MEDSHFNSSYFWSPVSTGQIENTMFINKMKDQLVSVDKAGSFAPPGGTSHYPTAVLTMPGSAVTMEMGRGGGKSQEGGGHLHPPHTSQQNITVVPVPSTGIMTAAGEFYSSVTHTGFEANNIKTTAACILQQRGLF
ncbi:ZN384 protein, partial [Polyodon spathula]|nr:ZN384 protein [Polyodon spathula]